MSHLENDCVHGSGDVVIVVPAMGNLPEAPSRSDHSHRICIDAEAEMEPNSPKTITESSSELKKIFVTFSLVNSNKMKKSLGLKHPQYLSVLTFNSKSFFFIISFDIFLPFFSFNALQEHLKC